jgi:hypothetical protein
MLVWLKNTTGGKMNRKARGVVSVLFMGLLFWAVMAFPLRIDIEWLSEAKEQSEKLNRANVNFMQFPKELGKFEVYPWETLKLQDFSKSYTAIIGSKVKEK